MREIEFNIIRNVLNRSLKPHKFGPQERIDFALRINSMWAIMLSEGTDAQKEYFKSKFTKFCKLYKLPVPDFPGELSKEGLAEIEKAIEATLQEAEAQTQTESTNVS